MIPTFLIVIALLGAMYGVMRMRSTPAALPQHPAPRDAHRASVPTAVHAKAQPGVIEWDAPLAPAAMPPLAAGAHRARIRDRYISARFPGVFRGSADLREIGYVIKVARHNFEEGKLTTTHELFSLAVQESPTEPALRLAELEITFLERDVVHFTRLARELQAAFPGIAAWADVARLGRALAPEEPLFGTPSGDRAHEHYGPWPDMPNWIQASWDLTPEVLAADLHRAMANRAHDDPAAVLRRVA